MKTLTLLRHAESGWDDGVACDFDRTLTSAGRRAARAVGRRLGQEDVRFDHVLASPARRVAETIAEVEAGCGRTLSPAWDRRLYLAPVATLVELVRDLPDAHARVLLVGHNPGLAEMVLELVPEGEAGGAATFPPAALAELGWEGGWDMLRPHGATLRRFTRPRDLDPTLGA